MSISDTPSAISVNLGTILRLTNNAIALDFSQNRRTIHINALNHPCVLVGRDGEHAYILLVSALDSLLVWLTVEITTFGNTFIEQMTRLRYSNWRFYIPIHPTRSHAALDQIQLHSVGLDLRGYVDIRVVHMVPWGALVAWSRGRARSPHINFTHLDADSWYILLELMRREGIRIPRLRARI